MSKDVLEPFRIESNTNADIFIVKGKDFTIKTDMMTFNFWQYENEEKGYDYEGLRHETLYPLELDLLFCDCDIDAYSIKLDQWDISICSFDNNKMKIMCEGLEKKDLEFLCYSYEDVEERFNLPRRCIVLTFTKFKEKFNLKGTKKQFIENPPNDFELYGYTTRGEKWHYKLYKIVEINFEYHVYECSLN